MARVMNEARYLIGREIEVGTVAAGHTVLIRSPEGTVLSYTVCKVGATKLTINDPERPVMLVNHITGRVVLKMPSQPCVLVSASILLKNYTGAYTVKK